MSDRVLVVFPHHSPFIDQDLRILGRKFEVTPLVYRTKRDRFRLLHELQRSRIAIAWFVLGYAYAMTRFRLVHRAKNVLIPGGWDVESMPDLEYGEMRSPRRALRTTYALSTADRVLAVSDYALRNVRKWAPDARASVLYHGFDSEIFTPGTEERRGVLTVARVTPGTWNLKGLKVFREVARRLPEVPFTIVGDIEKAGSILADVPPNLELTGALSQRELISAYQRAQVYAQLSAVESFGCALAEAMLCGCVPVVTDRGALPEVVGSVGYQTRFGFVNESVDTITQALESPDGARARARIQEMFPLRRRSEGLVNEVERLLDAS